MTDHTIHVPWRSRVFDMSDGTKQIHISLNGRLALALAYDARTDTITELPLPNMHDNLEIKGDDHG